MPTRYRNQGQLAEQQAIQLLRANGLKLITRNFHSRYGEIDIIMRSSSNIIFCEVKMRTHTKFGSPLEFVTYSKQRKIINTAHIFLQQNPKYQQLQPRFDVVGITPEQTTWVKSAFHLSY